MNKIFITLVLLLTMAFSSLFYLAKCGGGDAFVGGFAGGAVGSMIGGAIANNNNRDSREVEVVERNTNSSDNRLDRIEDELAELRKDIKRLERRIHKLETTKYKK